MPIPGPIAFATGIGWKGRIGWARLAQNAPTMTAVTTSAILSRPARTLTLSERRRGSAGREAVSEPTLSIIMVSLRSSTQWISVTHCPGQVVRTAQPLRISAPVHKAAASGRAVTGEGLSGRDSASATVFQHRLYQL